jgi:hypothetical protein
MGDSMSTVYMLSHSTWTDGIILRYATDEAGLVRIALEYYYGDHGQAHVEVNMDEMEVRISVGGILENVFSIFTVEGVE